MFTNYDVRRKKLSFSYDIPYEFSHSDEFYTGESERNLLKRRDDALIKFLNGDCDDNYLKSIDRAIDDQRFLRNQLDNVNTFSTPSLMNYDNNFLAEFANNYLSIDPFKFLSKVPIFEIENMHFCVYMPIVNDLGQLEIDKNRIGDISVTVEITVITVDISLENFMDYAKTVFTTVNCNDIDTYSEVIDDLGEVDEHCTIVKKIEETNDGMKLYGYKEAPKSPVCRSSELLFTERNQEFARRLYCGTVWTHDALDFARTYYAYRD